MENKPLTEESLAEVIEKVASEKVKYSGFTFFVQKISDHMALNDMYVYFKLCGFLGLNVESVSHTNIIMKSDKNDYALTINAIGDPEQIDKLNRMWCKMNEMFGPEVRERLQQCLEMEFFYETE